jgi:hypothetical protein
MEPDVAIPHRPVDRVRHGVQEDVAVGVAEEPHRVVDPNPSQPEVPARDEAVRIPAQADAEVGLLREQAGRHPQIFRQGDLEIRLLAGEGDDRPPGRFHEGGVVGPLPSVPQGERVRLAENLRPEPLRGLRAQEPGTVPRDEGARRPVPGLQRIPHGDHRNRRPVEKRLLHAPVEQTGGREGADRVVHEDDAGILRYRRQRVAHGILAPRAPAHHRDHLRESPVRLHRFGGGSRGECEDDRRDPGGGGNRGEGPVQEGAPAEGKELLGHAGAHPAPRASGDDDDHAFDQRTSGTDRENRSRGIGFGAAGETG